MSICTQPNSKAQSEVIVALAAYTATRRYSPSLRELAAILGISPSATCARLKRIRRKGLVDWADGMERTLHLTDEGDRILSEMAGG
jgi:repressor LexA